MQDGFAEGLTNYLCLLLALCVHEAAHAAMANWRGDPSARLLGRMTLNPLAHVDIIGTVVMPLVLAVSGTGLLFGWAKPVPFNPGNLKNIRRDPVWIALAGPVSNLLLAFVVVFLVRIGILIFGLGPALSSPLWPVAMYLVAINVFLTFFNLMPVPPLDGHHVLYYFLPPKAQRVMDSIGPFGIIIAIFAFSKFLAYPVLVFIHLVYAFLTWGTG